MAGVSKTIDAVADAMAFRVLYWWRQHCKQISNGCLEIFKKIVTLLTVNRSLLFTFFNLILDASSVRVQRSSVRAQRNSVRVQCSSVRVQCSSVMGGYSVAQWGSSVRPVGCSMAQWECSVAQWLVRWAGVRQPRVRFPPGTPPSAQQNEIFAQTQEFIPSSGWYPAVQPEDEYFIYVCLVMKIQNK